GFPSPKALATDCLPPRIRSRAPPFLGLLRDETLSQFVGTVNASPDWSRPPSVRKSCSRSSSLRHSKSGLWPRVSPVLVFRPALPRLTCRATFRGGLRFARNGHGGHHCLRRIPQLVA